MFAKSLKFAKEITGEQAKDSGLALAVIFLLLAIFLKSFLCVKIGLLVLLLDMVWPMLFRWFAFLWFGLSKILGVVMTKILLSAVFYIFIVPVGLVRKALGKDSMKLREFKKSAGSALKDRNHLYEPKDLDNQY